MNKDNQTLEEKIKEIVIQLAKKHGFMHYDQVIKKLSTLLNTEIEKERLKIGLAVTRLLPTQGLSEETKDQLSLILDYFYELNSPKKQDLDKKETEDDTIYIPVGINWGYNPNEKLKSEKETE
jgi:hypothetical protein